MLPTRYWRDGPEFWLAYWYHEFGPEGVELPEPVTFDWWEGRLRQHIDHYGKCIDLYVPLPFDVDPWETKHKKLLEKIRPLWNRLGYRCIDKVWRDDFGMEYMEMLEEYAPDLKLIARQAIMIREAPKYGFDRWNRGDRRMFNRATTVIGSEARAWMFDIKKLRTANSLDGIRYQIDFSLRLQDLLIPETSALT